MMKFRSLLLAGSVMALAACGQKADAPKTPPVAAPEVTPEAAPEDTTAPTESVADIHERLLVLDSHLDTPANFSNDDYSLVGDNPSVLGSVQVDLPKMTRGGLDGGYWVIYTAQGPLTETAYASALDSAMTRANEIIAAAAEHSDSFEIATRADDAARIVGAGKRVMYMSMENAYPIGEDIGLVEAFFDKGVRLIGPVHFRDNQLADSATDLSRVSYGGLSELGEALVKEANRLGMVVDGSHAGDDTVRDIMELSSTPILLSHTGVKGVFDHPRNIDDALMKEIAADGGVIQINGLGAYLEDLQPSPERATALEALDAEFDGVSMFDLSPDDQAKYREKRTALDEQFPRPHSTFDKFMEHLLYALELVGPEHIGMGADWDGGGGVTGMEDVSHLPKVTERLLATGYSETDLEKIWGGNMIRLMRQAEASAEK